MLTLTIGGTEVFNEEDQTFSVVDSTVLQLEHSLLSLSKWESKTLKPFLSTDKKTPRELELYVEAMIITSDFEPDIVRRFSQKDLDAVNAYINSSESATTFGNMPETKGRGEIVTSELIYYWMVMFNIPFHPCETWHLNRLLALIRIANIKNSKSKKMSRHELVARNRALNEERRAKLNTRG
jgi:hypothetical protein